MKIEQDALTEERENKPESDSYPEQSSVLSREKTLLTNSNKIYECSPTRHCPLYNNIL